MIPQFAVELTKLGTIMMENISEVDFVNPVPCATEWNRGQSHIHPIMYGRIVKIKVRCMVILSLHGSREI